MKRIEIKNTCLSLYSQILYICVQASWAWTPWHLCLVLLLGIAVGVQTNLCNSWFTRPILPRVVRGCLRVSPSQRTPCESCEFRKSENPRRIRSSYMENPETRGIPSIHYRTYGFTSTDSAWPIVPAVPPTPAGPQWRTPHSDPQQNEGM